MAVEVSAKIKDKINFAAVHCKKAFIEDVTISGADTGSVVCRITAVPPIIYEYKQEVTLTNGKAVIKLPEVVLDDSYYRSELIEAQDGEIKIDILNKDDLTEVLGFCNTKVHMQPYLHWDAMLHRDTTAAFMQPNDPLVANVLKKAGEYANKAGGSMHGYQGHSREDVKRQAEYIYMALADMKLHYISSPASFETVGQKIRIPHHVLHDEAKQGTCLDLAILYATCLEAASLNSFIVFIPGHAFSGVYLERVSASKAVILKDEVTADMWTGAAAKMLPVECTTYTDGRNISFASAVSIAEKNMAECQWIADVEGSRIEDINPVYTYTDKPICSREDEMPQIPEKTTRRKRSRLEILRDQAMDLSVRNKLLNHAGEKNIEVKLEVETAGLMVDHDKNGSVQGSFSAISLKGTKKKQRNDALHKLSILSRQAKREKGRSNLYISINELKWCQDDSNKYYKAPIYLCPAEIYKNDRGEYGVEIDFKQMRFNPVLKQLLMQQELNCDSLMDCPGTAYSEQMDRLRYLIENQKGWALEENTAKLTTYPILNEAVWQGLASKTLMGHDIVQSILKGEMEWETEAFDAKDISDTREVYPYQTDSSQSEIIRSAFKNKVQVVDGPAGVGKSQTVANIMLEAMNRGENVLFVSEKAPALEVVHEMLAGILNDVFTLMIINGKHDNHHVASQINKMLEFMARWDEQNPGQLDALSKRYKDSTEYIKDYYKIMREQRACGMSLDELMEQYENYRSCPIDFKLDEKSAAISLDEAEEKIQLYAAAVERCDRTEMVYADYIKYDKMLGADEAYVTERVQDAIDAYERLMDLADQLSRKLSLSKAKNDKQQLERIHLIAATVDKCPECGDTINNILNKAVESDAAGEAFKQELLEALEDYKAKGRQGNEADRFEKVKGFFNKVAKRTPEDRVEDLLNQITDGYDAENAIRRYKRYKEDIMDQIRALNLKKVGESEYVAIQGDEAEIRLKKYLSNFDKSVNRYVQDKYLVYEDIAKIRSGLDQIVSGQNHDLKILSQNLEDLRGTYVEAQKEISEKLLKNQDEFKEKYPDMLKVVLFREWLEKRHINANNNEREYNHIAALVEEAGLGCIAKQIKDIAENYKDKKATLSKEDIVAGYCKSWYRYQIEKIKSSDPKLRDYAYITFNVKVNNYLKQEVELRKKIRENIVVDQMNRLPNVHQGVKNKELGELQLMVRKKPAIREFFEKAPTMLQKICPCMLMNPTAVAEYIPENFPLFDLVIIDEGSQMPTYDALIPISHAKRCVILGDERQLKPMDYFLKKRMDEDGTVQNQDSILTDAICTSFPHKMLKFHYRSSHESLIAFSNNRYYNNQIITFPSCDTSVTGVSYEYVEDGIYDRGGKRTNDMEAEHVVQKVKDIYAGLPDGTKETVGIVTLNIQQRDLIQSKLMDALIDDSAFGEKADELVNVVNLESCQGREWDYVILSPAYGKDKDGRLSKNFGAINREDGMNRLNVMITRARKQMVVITSLEPSMLESSQSESMRDFKDFLSYAKGENKLDTRQKHADRTDTGLIASVARALEAKGYEVHTDIGSSNLKVDIGIVSPDDKSKYIMGILVDHFKSDLRNVRDREVIYPEALKQKGWNIYRLHSMSWDANAEEEIGEIIKEIVKVRS